jgi:hypothetical protein
MAIDGKSIKSTLVGGNSSYQNFVSLVSVYSHERGWVVRHKVMENHHGVKLKLSKNSLKNSRVLRYSGSRCYEVQ